MPTAKSSKCGVCGVVVNKSKGSITCSKCNMYLHPSCAGLSEKQVALSNEKPQSFSFTCNACLNDSSNDSVSLRDEVRVLSNSFNDFAKANQEGRVQFEATISKLLSDFKTEVSGCIKEMKSDIYECRKLINKSDAETTSKLKALEKENNVLHRRLIVLTSLLVVCQDLITALCSLCSSFGLDISKSEIFHVCYMNNKRLILAKFNSVQLRDTIMKEYFRKRTLKVSDVIGGEIGNRVYLNDHYSPAASDLNMLCRKLKKQKSIIKYKILNSDVLRARLTLDGGKKVVYTVAECAALYDNNTATLSG